MYLYQQRTVLGEWSWRKSADKPLFKNSDGGTIYLKNVMKLPECIEELPISDLIEVIEAVRTSQSSQQL